MNMLTRSLQVDAGMEAFEILGQEKQQSQQRSPQLSGEWCGSRQAKP